MKLATFTTPEGATRVGALQVLASGEVLVDVEAAVAAFAATGAASALASAGTPVPSDLLRLLEGGAPVLAAAAKGVAYVTERCAGGPEALAVAERAGLLHHLGGVRFLPPILRPGKIISVGANYPAHLDEFDDENTESGALKVLQAGRVVDYPPAFAKLSSTMVGHEGDIVYPPHTRKLDYEGELCVVIGKRCKDVPPDRYLDVIAGYTIMNDVSMRDIQMKEMQRGIMLMGKNLDTTAPTGPYLVTKDEIRDPQQLRIRTFVNGDLRQNASTAEMIFDIATIIAFYSRMTLEPGDIFTTGSPAGVGFTRIPPEDYLLKPGDVVEIEIEGVGRLRNRVVAAPHQGEGMDQFMQTASR